MSSQTGTGTQHAGPTFLQEEIDQKSVIRLTWRKLLELCERVTDMLHSVQGKYKKQLVKNVKELKEDVRKFRREWETSGPMVQGISPLEAVERLRRFKEEMQLRERTAEMYTAGEELFALKITAHPDLIKIKKESSLLDQLYGLYMDVLQTLERYREVLWTSAGDELVAMSEMVASFDSRCRKMPKKLREWEAFQVLLRKITDFQEVLPIIENLRKPSIKPRHWQEVMDITKTNFPYESENFSLSNIMDSPILQFKDDIEEICEGADKQLSIAEKLDDITDQWDHAAFEFTPWKSRGVPVLKAYGVIIEELEDAQLQLQTLLSMRHVTPFREIVQNKLNDLSNATDSLELWVKVQLLWTSLESVFMGGDIAKQMPIEAKKFVKIDKDWAKTMIKAEETEKVIMCCASETLCTTLPVLFVELEKCQKSLEGYLEQKRSRFPRFYFVSNPVLLLVLSQGSDPVQMQPYYEKVFDSISQVVHDKKEKSSIISMVNIAGSDEETISFSKPVKATGNIEDWLGALEKGMQVSLKSLAELAAVQCTLMPLRQFVDCSCGQFALLGLQFSWTAQCQEALDKCRTNKSIMSETNRGQLGVLQEMSSWCLQDLGTKMNRTKIETLVTIQVHQRDVFMDLTRLYKERKIHNSMDFEWLKQARFYWRPGEDDAHGAGSCAISICDVDFKYRFEYLGCKERLVITPLTDRCYITLSQALGMFLGGAPAGPAGTGKTETVKDLGRSLGNFVVVTNCTDQQRYTDMAKIFKGLCQAGLWGCFDEFNRIELPVLSVVAQQVLAITNAKRVGAKEFVFPGDSQVIGLKRDVAYFITMNPGYQGRQELPENLKVLFRSVAMMVPDREIIMKVKLCSVGYQGFSDLARKFNVLYALCEQQLSKQKHYDFGLRNILSVLRTAGKTKRDNLDENEDLLLMKTLRDMNLSKLIAQDVPLFLSLLGDLFPAVVAGASGDAHAEVESAAKSFIDKEGLIAHPSWCLKVIQLYETTLVRHGVMMVGPPGSGKSSTISTLQSALTKTTGVQHKPIRMNPKAIRAEEMFGETNKASGEWVDGVFAAMWSKFNDRNRKDMQWIICDGPVDAIWIENLNTVLDDNKILTLANGDRIPMTDNVKLIFEVEDLRNASPATVSRAGIIYVSDSDLDWQPVMESRLKKLPPGRGDILREFFRKYVGECLGPKEPGHLFDFITRTCRPVMNCTRVGQIEATIRLLSEMLESSDMSQSPEDAQGELERLFLFSVSWALGGLLEPDERVKFDQYLQQLCPENMPSSGGAAAAAAAAANDGDSVSGNSTISASSGLTVFDYSVNLDTMAWEPWVVPAWEYPKVPAEVDFQRLLVPTVDSTRALAIINHLQKQRHPVLMVGGSGTAKTTTALMYFDSLTNDSMMVKRINFSSATTAGMFQSTIEGELDKRGGKNFGPPSGCGMTVFLDDVSMPEVNEWDDQPTLEVVRQLVETGGFCFLDKDKRGDLKVIEDLQYVGAMNHPGAGKNDIPNRLKRHFFIFNMIVPPEESINAIYGQMVEGRFPAQERRSTFHLFSERLPAATTALWRWMRAKMLPSPSKFHYTFNMRELSRVFQGLLRAPKDSIPTEVCLMKLWRHECCRVFADKLTTIEDKEAFQKELDHQTALLGRAVLETPEGRLLTYEMVTGESPGEDEVSPPTDEISLLKAITQEAFFVDFLRTDEYDEDGVLIQAAPKVYEEGPSLVNLRAIVQGFAEQYNLDFPANRMDLVLFDDALRHLITVSRILGMPRGNMLFVGVGGSGKQSLTRLASYIAGNFTFQITITKAYNLNSFMDDMRCLYKKCGQEGKNATFVLTEAEMKDETFLEIMNSFLMTGEVPNLFPKDELHMMAAEIRPFAISTRPDFVDTPENLARCFVDRVRANLHCVICMSPVSVKFPERARKFPGLVNGCTINWFLSWPAEALVAVSDGYIGNAPIECSAEVHKELVTHMGMVHRMVVESCADYFVQMRRRVYQTPRSFLSFLGSYKDLYLTKKEQVDVKSKRVIVGLDKLKKGASDVELMKVQLKEEEVKLKEADLATTKMLSKLEVSSMAAKKEADAVAVIKEACMADARRIAGEKEDAEEDLAQAKPFLEEAERAVESIKAGDLNELKKLQKPSDIIKLIFDCVGLLKMEKVQPVQVDEVTIGIGKEKQTLPFLKDSFKYMQAGMLSDARFLQSIFAFSQNEKDFINDETVELMAPYLELEGFNPAVARNASKAAEGLCTWCRAMTYYHEASKVVKPKLEALRIAEVKLQDAQKELEEAESKLQNCQDVLTKLQTKFEAQMAKKRAIEENAARTRSRMEQATALIVGLGGERTRWTEDSRKFADTKRRLVGDVALSCAFVGYCGPFNQEFRDHLVKTRFSDDLVSRGIPLTKGLDLTSFLVDMGTIGDWNLDGLPTDPLSIQNGILVTRSSRYPLLIDPQGQALNWIRRHEKDRLPASGVTSFSSDKLRDTLEYCMMEGKALIIAGVEEDIDPMLTPVLEKQIVVKARSKYINVADKMCEFSDSFMLYMTTRLPNPHLSPENQAKTTVVDFTVTQKGLEEQLLGGVIQKEQKSLEEQLKNVLEEVTNNTKALMALDQLLLERLSANTGNLLDDEELIGALAETKKKAVQVRDKLVAAGEMREGIDEKREQYRPVATRGAVMYFTIVDLSLVNVMYQTSLDQFQTLFTRAMDVADKASLASKRVWNIIETMTFNVYRYISRGLYEQDKLSFKLILALKILLTARRLDQSDVTLFIKGGAALDLNAVKPKPYLWLADPAWLNAIQLSRDNVMFKSLPDEIIRNEAAWKLWYAENEPEEIPVPYFEGRLAADPSVGAFYRLLLVRSLREDRTLLCVNNFIRLTDTVEHAGSRLPAMGPRFAEPLTDTVESVYNEMDCSTPVIYLLSAGADPTDSIEGLARKKKTDVACVSMGEGQSVVASRAIAAATVNGSWVLLQNCHLGLDYMETMEDYLQTLPACHTDFRLFITSEPHPKFPIGLLQMSIKVTNEPPKGLRAGLLRSFTVIVDQDKLERVDSSQWRALLYSLCFLHSVVQERRKFGSLGWCIPYEFNDGDLNACATFLEKHLYSGSVSWPTVQYMVGEVQYGGKITDDLDRRLFKAYTETWMGPPALSASFCFNPGVPMQGGPQFKYVIPDSQEVEDYIAFIQTFPGIDGPEVFGLHPNADLTFRNKEGQQLLATLMETQPKQATGGTGRSREDMVLEKCTELLLAVPEGFTEASYLECIAAQGGLGVPLNIFLMQEVQRLQLVIINVGGMLKTLLQAIRGEVVVTEDLMSAINAVYDARVPRQWVFSYGGDEISWMSASLGLWFSSFTARNEQLATWLTGGRPPCFWLTGFFNPQGFVTAVQQEVTRAHKADRWSLDGVVLHTEVTEFEKSEQVKAPPKEGVYIHGLYLDGAQWNRSENSLVESKPKELFSSVPVMYVTAVTKAQRKALSGDYGPHGGFDCPVYKYSLRTDKYIIFLVTLAARSKHPSHWTLRGVALLCGSGDSVQ
ncbi:dynein heavy chain [Ectocarpus siliculosus]|uniref:Dynein heavy chain n=1 Tax=Ectocarpus siliculosus TaxID=2880 RepID=D8LQB6_ECTSI|nr:dynein heavy chain [Ectocarpus siliculosus]|eukprot:CBN78680.1 dynein heavy chain [Ectocarpus siliculosus]